MRQALIPSRWLAADARVERAGARPSRAVVRTALTCGFLLTLWYGFWAASRAGKDFFGNLARPLPAHLSPSLLGIAETVQSRAGPLYKDGTDL
jgi:hypothetical protein